MQPLSPLFLILGDWEGDEGYQKVGIKGVAKGIKPGDLECSFSFLSFILASWDGSEIDGGGLRGIRKWGEKDCRDW